MFPQLIQREQYTHADYAYVHQELKRKGVTLQLLWEEYHGAHGERAYQYSLFCWRYQRFRDSLARSMRRTHRAGEKLFIDYSGDTLAVIKEITGEIAQAEIFIASIGASRCIHPRQAQSSADSKGEPLHPKLQEELTLTRSVVVAFERRTHDLARSALVTWESRYE